MSGIFLSYRRDDSAGHAGWLHHLLAQHFGEERIFRDVDTIEPGLDFAEAIDAAVSSCDVLLAVIGKHWTAVVDENGQCRLDDPNDFVRLEIRTGLTRGIRVIPVLVHGARIPKSQELPEDLQPLARRRAFELRDTGWTDDVEELIRVLEKLLPDEPARGSVDRRQAPMDLPSAIEPEPDRDENHEAYLEFLRKARKAGWT